jgi:hypothetical protein
VNRTPLFLLPLLVACGEPAPRPAHEASHEPVASAPDPGPTAEAHEHAAAHEHGAVHERAAAATPFSLGPWTAALHPQADGLRLTAAGADGARVTPEGEVRVVLTGTGEPEQRVVLIPDGEGWTGPARAEGAPGYVAVVSATIAGRTETARVTWGEVPAPAHPADHAHEGEADHGHDDHGHAH